MLSDQLDIKFTQLKTSPDPVQEMVFHQIIDSLELNLVQQEP